MEILKNIFLKNLGLSWQHVRRISGKCSQKTRRRPQFAGRKGQNTRGLAKVSNYGGFLPKGSDILWNLFTQDGSPFQ